MISVLRQSERGGCKGPSAPFTVIVLALASLILGLAKADAVSETKLKAAFLYNFTKFVEWPAERFESPDAPIVIGLLAEGDFEAEIATIVANRRVNGRALIVRPVVSIADMQAAHILFVSAQQESRFIALRDLAQPAAVLAVGDAQGCRAFGGGICFVQEGEKLRFEIDMNAVERSHLKISAQLQRLAVAVHRGH